jgi:thiamine pyrophosphate-dependent acetolactate synthase large subunit-like protein
MSLTDQRLDRRAAVAELLRDRGALLLVTGLGGTTWDAAAVGDTHANFYLWGGMGLAVPMGLGLALAQPQRRVLVITGDGEMLMGLGSLATVANQPPPNLAIVVIDNERYGETGEQLTHTAGATDLAAVARASGIADSRLVTGSAGLSEFRQQLHGASAPLFAVIKVAAGNPPMVLPPRDGVMVKYRFRAALLGAG